MQTTDSLVLLFAVPALLPPKPNVTVSRVRFDMAKKFKGYSQSNDHAYKESD